VPVDRRELGFRRKEVNRPQPEGEYRAERRGSQRGSAEEKAGRERRFPREGITPGPCSEFASASIVELSAEEVNEEVGEEHGPGVGMYIIPAHAIAVANTPIVELSVGGMQGKYQGQPLGGAR
jgi:hypothetical protein